MNIIGHGIDIVELERFGRLTKSESYLRRCFTDAELHVSKGQSDRLGARFAAKEAVLKALHTGMVDGISLTDVEIIFNSKGAPDVRLGGEPARLADELGITAWHLSFSHGLQFAIASAIAVGT